MRMPSLRLSLTYSTFNRSWKTGKAKNVAIKLKNIILRYCCQVSFDHNLHDTKKISPKFALLNSDCLALTFWKSRLPEITVLVYERAENPELHKLGTDMLSLQEMWNILKCKRFKASQIHKIDHFHLAFHHFCPHALNSKNTFKQWLTKGLINYPLMVALHRKILEEVDNRAFNAGQNGVQQITQGHTPSNSDKKKHLIKLLFRDLFCIC